MNNIKDLSLQDLDTLKGMPKSTITKDKEQIIKNFLVELTLFTFFT